MKNTFHIIILLILLLSCENVGLNSPNTNDTTPPIVNIVYPANQATVKDRVNISIYAYDNLAIEKVKIFINDSIVYDNTLETFQLNTLVYDIYQYEWDTKLYEEDEYYTISASVKDSSGNYSHANPIQVQIDNNDNIKPNGILISPSSGQVINGNVEIVIFGEDDNEIDYLTLFISGDSVETFPGLDLSENYFHYFWNTLEAQEDVLHNIHAEIIDVSGNHNIIGPINVYVNNQSAPDILPPQGTIVHPPSGAIVNSTVNIEINAYDNIAISKVDFIIDGTVTHTDSIYPYIYEWNTIEYGEDLDHIINIDIYDLAGNMTSLYPIAVYINNIPELDMISPVITIYEPASNQTLSGIVSFLTIVTDNDSIDRVEFYKDYTLFYTDSLKFEANDSLPPHYTCEWNTLNEIDNSQFVWFAKAYDMNGNMAQTTPMTIFVDNIDNIAPTGSIIFPYAGQLVNNEVPIQVTAEDNISISHIEFYINGVLEYEDTEEPYSYEWNTTLYEEDLIHVISVFIYDDEGNYFEDNINVTVDNIPLSQDDTSPPFASILTPVSGQTVQDSVFVSGFATDNYSVFEVVFYIEDQIVATLNDTPYTYIWDTQSLENNSEYIIQMIASDEAGNESSAQPVLITVDNSN